MNRLQKPFDYIFYRIAGIWYKRGFDRDMPEINAFGIVSLIQSFNLLFLISITGLINMRNINEYAYVVVPIYLSLLTINGIFILNKKKLDLCKLRWQDETKKTKRIRGGLIIGYIFFSIALFILSLEIITSNEHWVD